MTVKSHKKIIPSQAVDPFLGQRFLQALNSLCSTAKIHLDNNRLLQNCIDNFALTIKEFMRFDDEINLLASVGCFYLQQEKVALQHNTKALTFKMLTYFENRKLKGLCFNQSTVDISNYEILTFIRLLNHAENEKNPLFWLQSKLDEMNYHWVEIIDTSQAQSLAAIFMKKEKDKSSTQGDLPQRADPEQKTTRLKNNRTQTKIFRPAGSPQIVDYKKQKKKKKTPSALKRKQQSRTDKAIRTYCYAMHSLQNVAERLATNNSASLGKSVQLIQSMVDQIINDNNVLIGLSTIRDYDDYTFTHSVNVSILSLCLGHRIGLNKISLCRIGLSALFHDLGKIDVPKDILNKPDRLTEKEFGIIKQHSINSVRRILKLRASYDRKATIILPPFEHHLRYDLSGYPKTPRNKSISLFGRIITIADIYDAITAPRVYRKNYLSPDKALGLMLKDSGTEFDPVLLKVFINMLGIYPIGTVLVFDNGEVALVTQAPDETAAPEELWALMLKKKKNGEYKKGVHINLGIWNVETRTFNRRIQKTLHPADLGIQPAEFYL